MPALSYVNFDVTLARRNGASGYAIQVDSPAGQSSSELQASFTPEELADLRRTVEGPARDIQMEESQRGQPTEYRDKVRLFGGLLYEQVFDVRIRPSLMTTREQAQRNNQGVRIRLHLDGAPELAALPWEYLFDRAPQQHLAIAYPIVRYLRLDHPPSALMVTPPLKILVMAANPAGHPHLDADREFALIQDALADLQKAGLVTIRRLPRATAAELQASLQQEDWHVFHFIGHGGRTNGDAVLLFEDDRGASDEMTSELLNAVLQHPSLRLVVLNSCDGAHALDSDPFSGLAQGLVRARIPAVIAMQFKITDQGAIKLAKEFYSALTRNLPVDQALAEARKAMFAARNPTEWGTPVLFMRGDDGRVFDVKRPTEQELRELQIETLTTDARAALGKKRYDRVIELMREIKKLEDM